MTDKAAILAEIYEFCQAAKAQEVPENCITFQEIEAQHGWSHCKAQKVMAGLVQAGKFERIELGGKIKVVFRKIG